VDAFDTSASANFNQSGMGNRRRRGACPHASFWLDLRIALYTLISIFTGERCFEQAVRDANTQQRNGHYKPQIIAHRAEPREISTARGQPPARLPINARVRATQQRRAQVD